MRENTAASPDRAAAALKGLRRYQEAERPAPPRPRPAIGRSGRATLREIGGSGPSIFFVPSLINPPAILDLPGHSLLAWLAEQGIGRVLMVDWGEASPDHRGLDMANHVGLLLDLLDELPEPPALAGYCLGGTMALAAAAHRPTRRLALIATPWCFGGYPGESLRAIDDLWEAARPTADALGLLPMEALQAGFWRLDPTRTVDKFARFGRIEPDSRPARDFVALEDWANDGPPLPLAAARELFDDFFAGDLPGRGRWEVGGQTVDPAELACPILNVVSSTDRIVPAASAAPVGERLDLSLGHVGMVVGSSARRALWEPLATFLSERQSPR